MVAILTPFPKFRAFDANGDPLAGGKVYTYRAGTSTAKATFSDQSGTVANANPTILDANGEADIWLATDELYKFQLDNAQDVQQWVVDNVGNIIDPQAALTAGAVPYGDGTGGFKGDPDFFLYDENTKLLRLGPLVPTTGPGNIRTTGQGTGFINSFLGMVRIGSEILANTGQTPLQVTAIGDPATGLPDLSSSNLQAWLQSLGNATTAIIGSQTGVVGHYFGDVDNSEMAAVVYNNDRNELWIISNDTGLTSTNMDAPRTMTIRGASSAAGNSQQIGIAEANPVERLTVTKWDPSYQTPVAVYNTQRGITSPPAPTVTVETGSSSLTAGVYSYKVTALTPNAGFGAGGETEASAKSVDVTITNPATQQIRVDIPVILDHLGNPYPNSSVHRNVYRTKANESDWQFEGVIADNSNTVFQSGSVADTSLGASAPTVNTATVGIGAGVRMIGDDGSGNPRDMGRIVATFNVGASTAGMILSNVVGNNYNDVFALLGNNVGINTLVPTSPLTIAGLPNNETFEIVDAFSTGGTNNTGYLHVRVNGVDKYLNFSNTPGP